MLTLGLNEQWNEKDKGRISPRRDVPIQRVTTIAPLVEDFSFFTLAPLYVFAGIGISLPDQFEMLTERRRRIIVDYQRKIFRGLGGWGSLIEGIETAPGGKSKYDDKTNDLDTSTWTAFCAFLQTCGFTDVKKRTYWQTWAQPIALERPEQSIVQSSDRHVLVMVIMPDGNRGRLNVKPGFPAEFYWEPPRAEIIQTAEKAFAIKEGASNEA
jgi:hypothetical protein